ncbi:MAG: HAD hydrolase-like protein [Candidatus Kaiserbacteria bacterium]|nr:HAD hydrolase-like protein [Candidatus Kaiserbacteria bacterium]MCB9815993.1 HAD hydrolase-like protein [Candidatus Nomurabacteria bacterium]
MEYLIFDFDGVLGNTWNAVIHGIVASGREPDTESAIENARRYASKRPFHSKELTLSDEKLAAEYEWIRSFGKIVHDHGFTLFDDLVQEILKLEDAKIAVVSSGSQNYVLPALQTTKLQPTHILAFEDHHSKEEKVALVCRDWGIPIEDVYYFTDTLADVYELKDLIAPDKLIGVSWGYCAKEQLLTELPENNILNTPQDLPSLFT